MSPERGTEGHVVVTGMPFFRSGSEPDRTGPEEPRVTDLERDLVEEQYRPEEDPYHPAFDPVFEDDDPVMEEQYARGLIAYQLVVKPWVRTGRLHAILRERLQDLPMSFYGDMVRADVIRCGLDRVKKPGKDKLAVFRCGHPVCPTCGERQKRTLAEELIPVVKGWIKQFGRDHVSYVSVDGEVCSTGDVAQALSRFRRAFENTHHRNLPGTEVRGEFELAPTDHDKLPMPKGKKRSKSRSRSRLKPDRVEEQVSLLTEVGPRLVPARVLHRDQDGDYILDQGSTIRVIETYGVEKVKVWDRSVSTKGGSPCTLNPLSPGDRVKVHCHVVICHPEMSRPLVRSILEGTFESKGGVSVLEIEDRYDRWGRRMDGVEFVCAYIFDKSSGVKGGKRQDESADNPGGMDAIRQAAVFDAYCIAGKGSRKRHAIHYGDVSDVIPVRTDPPSVRRSALVPLADAVQDRVGVVDQGVDAYAT